jgi:hypothetical protein
MQPYFDWTGRNIKCQSKLYGGHKRFNFDPTANLFRMFQGNIAMDFQYATSFYTNRRYGMENSRFVDIILQRISLS